jgi:outer membrane protein assembly factor BamE (lipoprotein component of BamABCDE complex)
MRAALIGVIGLAAACTVFVPKETLYLHEARGKATQQEVREKLGAPHLTATSRQGDPVWVYDVYFTDTTAQNSWGAPGTWCDEYVLTFDQKGLLSGYTHKSEGHGGELSPSYCVTDGYNPKR